jgi:GT2 family glycosyltransferase
MPAHNVELSPTENVTVVTVSYGRRRHLLRQVLAALPAQGVAKAVVVDNGSLDDLRSLESEFGPWVEVVRVERNTGSAGGFRAGLEHALAAGCEYLWLLDDDNLPQPGALQELLEARRDLQQNADPDQFALLSFRPEHQADLAAGVPLRRCYPRPGCFFGFHLLDLPYKIWRRTRFGSPRRSAAMPKVIPVPFAPYSGFFCHRSLVERIGLPNPELVLYADDTEFTSRLTALFRGKIYLVPNSRIDDLESSWNTKARFGSSFSGWICGDSDIRAYYASRNQAYHEMNRDHCPATRALNRCAYLFGLAILALLKRRMPRFRLLLEAIRSGEAARLGMAERFPLR